MSIISKITGELASTVNAGLDSDWRPNTFSPRGNACMKFSYDRRHINRRRTLNTLEHSRNESTSDCAELLLAGSADLQAVVSTLKTPTVWDASWSEHWYSKLYADELPTVMSYGHGLEQYGWPRRQRDRCSNGSLNDPSSGSIGDLRCILVHWWTQVGKARWMFISRWTTAKLFGYICILISSRIRCWDCR